MIEYGNILSYNLKQISKEEAIKRIIMSAMVSVMMLVSI